MIDPRGAAGSCEVVVQGPEDGFAAAPSGLQAWLERLVGALAPEADSFAVRLSDDEELRRINRTYRGKDRTTDVLSFPGETMPDGVHLGDVVISLPAVRRQAADAGHTPGRELEILILHGLLHCLGYDHESDDGTMDRLEGLLREQWLNPETAASSLQADDGA